MADRLSELGGRFSRTKNIIDWQATTDYKAGDEIVAPRNSDGKKRIWTRTADGTSGATFDPTEQALWEDLGESNSVQTSNNADWTIEPTLLSDRATTESEIKRIVVIRGYANETARLAETDVYSGLRGRDTDTGKTFTYDGTAWFEEANLAEWTELTAANPALEPGKHQINTVGGSFTVIPQNVRGEWEFGDPNFTTGANQLVIGDATQTFTDNSGAQVPGPYIVGMDGSHFILSNTDGSNNFRVISEPSVIVPPAFTPNNGWNANTNTPDLTATTNRVDNNKYYVYFITETGTQDLGNGAEEFEMGGQIFWYGTTTYRYDKPGKNGYSEDLFANRPIANTANIGLTFYATDTHQVFKSTGAVWISYESVRYFADFTAANAETIYPNQIFTVGFTNPTNNNGGTFMYTGTTDAGIAFSTTHVDIKRIDVRDVYSRQFDNITTNTTETIVLNNNAIKRSDYSYVINNGSALTLNMNNAALTANAVNGHLIVKNISSTQDATVVFNTGWNGTDGAAKEDEVLAPLETAKFAFFAPFGGSITTVQKLGSGGGNGLKRITLDPDDATFADATYTIDYSAHDEQLFESELFVIGERTITFNGPTVPAGADRKTLIHRVFISANTADVTVTFPAGTWRNADSVDDATDIVIPSGENRTLELTTLDNDGNEYVRVLGSGGSNMPMVDGYVYSGIDVANSSFGSGAISFNSSSFNTIYDPKGLVDAGGSTITIDSPEKAGAYMMALNVTSGTSGGAVVARVNGVNRLTARGEDGSDSDAAVGVIELNEGDVVTISVVSGNTTYGVSFTMSQVSRFIDQTQFVSSEQIIPVEDARVLLASGSDTNVSGTESLTLAGGRTLADLGTEFASIEFSVIDGSWDNSVTGVAVDAETLVISQAVKISGHGSSGTRYFINGDFSSGADTTILVSTDQGSNSYRRFRMWGVRSSKTVEALDTNLLAANTTEVGTPKNAGSTREYVLQWNGTEIVNTLAKEKWTSGTVQYIVDHLTRHMVIQGYQNITSSGSLNWIEPFADEHYTFAHDIREAQSERGVLRIATRSTTGITYVLYDETGTGDGGSVVHFTITGSIN